MEVELPSNSKLNLIKLVHVISDTNIGGAGRYLLTFLEYYDKNKFEVSVIVPKNSKLLEFIPNAIEIDGIADKSFSIKGVLEIRKVLKKIKPDIVHTHGALSGRIGAKLAGVKNITYTRHSVFPPSVYLIKGVGFYLNKWLNNWTCKKIIAVAEAASQNLIDSGVDKEKIEVIYNGVKPLGVRTKEQNEEFLRSIEAKAGVPTLAIAARLTAVKGQKYIIEAAKQLAEVRGQRSDGRGQMVESVPYCQIIIAGTGEEYDNLKNLAKKLGVLGNYIILAGFVDDIEGLMNACDIQLNASYGTEAASLALMEGMSLGKPSIVSDYGGNPELIADGVNGIITPQQAAEKIAEAIEKLLGDKELYKQMSENSKKIYEERFTAEKMVQKMEEFYAFLLQK